MIESKDFFRDILKLEDDNLIEILNREHKVDHVRKGKIILRAGEIPGKIYFLQEGLFRGFYIDSDGHEITDCFGFEPGTPMVSCLDLDTANPINIEILEDSTVVGVPLNTIMQCIDRSIDMLKMYNRFLRMSLEYHWENKMILARCSAAGRYEWFLKRYPGLVDRVSHKYIASFIGISPVSLSRVRKRLHSDTGK